MNYIVGQEPGVMSAKIMELPESLSLDYGKNQEIEVGPLVKRELKKFLDRQKLGGKNYGIQLL